MASSSSSSCWSCSYPLWWSHTRCPLNGRYTSKLNKTYFDISNSYYLCQIEGNETKSIALNLHHWNKSWFKLGKTHAIIYCINNYRKNIGACSVGPWAVWADRSQIVFLAKFKNFLGDYYLFKIIKLIFSSFFIT